MAVKPISFIVISALSAASALAQTELPYKSGKKNVTVEATLNLITGSDKISLGANDLRIRYFLSDKIAFRTRLNYASNSYTNNLYGFSSSDPMGQTTENSSSTGFALGAEYHFPGTSRLSPYAGIEIGMSMASGDLTGVNFDGRQYSPGSNYVATVTGGGGFSSGIVAGADFYIVHGIYIGGEIGYGYNYQFNGYLNASLNGVNDQEKELSTTSGFGLATNAGIRIGVRF